MTEFPLIIKDLTVPPAGEWSPQGSGWTVVRVAEGSGYCLRQKSASALQSGDGLMAPHHAGITVRASQLGSLRLHYFQVQPELLNGLLTLEECQQFKTLATRSGRIHFFRADELIGQQLSRLVKLPRVQKLALRCALLQLWAEGVAGLFALADRSGPGGRKLRERFAELAGQVPESELFGLSLGDLSRQLHCSERHLGRLFRQKFGVPFRTHQIELRLQRACHLLADTGTKVAAIAHECGYQHLGLFNSTFKKRFGMTPSQWRRKHPARN
ncbi:MAG TPA: helix-turn-helix transcriptional regulator [Candidatus Paceibacterota bacterium]|nr:helix-turn-helix transcriptional regulator [Candidatus Paceibacterota bacterium]